MSRRRTDGHGQGKAAYGAKERSQAGAATRAVVTLRYDYGYGYDYDYVTVFAGSCYDLFFYPGLVNVQKLA